MGSLPMRSVASLISAKEELLIRVEGFNTLCTLSRASFRAVKKVLNPEYKYLIRTTYLDLQGEVFDYCYSIYFYAVNSIGFSLLFSILPVDINMSN